MGKMFLVLICISFEKIFWNAPLHEPALITGSKLSFRDGIVYKINVAELLAFLFLFANTHFVHETDIVENIPES